MTAPTRAWRSPALRWSVVDLLIVAYALLPVIWLVSLSVTSPAAAGRGRLVPRDWTLQHYAALFTADTGRFARPLLNSAGIALITTLVAVALGAMAGYAVARLRFPGRRAVVAGTLLVALLPQASLAVPLFEIERRAGLLDTWPGLILPYVAIALPLAIYVLAAYFGEPSTARHAQSEAATPARLRTIARDAAPGLITAGVLVFLFTWNEFLFALTLTSTETARTVPPALVALGGAVPPERVAGTVSAAAVVVTVPVLVLVLVFQRRIFAGLTAGVVRD
jgi:multiple sugar transport system permease protein